jgi:hypothetical protein
MDNYRTVALTLDFLDIQSSEDVQWLAASPGVVSKKFLVATQDRLASMTQQAVKDLGNPEQDMAESASWASDLQQKLYKVSVSANAMS